MAQVSGKIEEKLLFYINKLSSGDEDKLETIQNLNALLISANSSQIRSVANQLSLEQFFKWINSLTFEHEASQQLVTLVSLFLEALPSEQIVMNHTHTIVVGMTSGSLLVRELWLMKIVEPTFSNPELLKKVGDSGVNLIPLVQSIVRFMKMEDTRLVPSIQSIVLSYAKQYRTEFGSPIIIEELRSILKSSNDVSKIRCFELCVALACSNDVLFNQIQAIGFIDDLLKAFEKALDKDLLVAVNYVKLVTDLVSKEAGLIYVKTNSLLPKAVELISKGSDDPLLALIVPSLINLIIRIAEFDITVLVQHPGVFQKVLQFCEERNGEFLFLAIDSIAYLCRKKSGKLYVDPHAQVVFKTLAWMLNSANQEIKLRALEVVGEILAIHDIDSANEDTIQLTERWFQLLASNGCPFTRFVEMIKDVSVRVPLLNLFLVLAQASWGQKILNSSKELKEYLFNANTEVNKQTRDAKAKLVRELSTSPFIASTFSPEDRLRLRQLLKSVPVLEDVKVDWI